MPAPILTIRDLLAGAGVKMPSGVQTFKKARKVKEAGAQQGSLFG